MRLARAAATLNHSDAMVVYDIGEHERMSYIVMDLVPRRTLREVTGEWLADASHALVAAHRKGLLHRKP